jgi:hypothetical protein
MDGHTPKIIHLPTGMEILFTAKDHSSQCPTCHQQTQLREMKLNKESGEALSLIAKRGAAGATPAIIANTLGRVQYANYTSLKYWGLIEKVKTGDKTHWRVTEIGMRFVRGEIALPETLWVYNDMPRFVREEMYTGWVTFNDLQPRGEMSREIAATNSVPLEASGNQQKLA